MTIEEDEKAQKEAEQKAEEESKAKADAATHEKIRAEEGETSIVKEAKKAAADLKTENDRREKILEDEKKLLDRKETLNALGGGSPGGQSTPSQFSEKEIASRKRIKAVADASGASWGKNYE